MAKHGAIQSIALAITMVIIVPLIKGETLSMPNTLIEFMIYIIIIICLSLDFYHWFKNTQTIKLKYSKPQ